MLARHCTSEADNIRCRLCPHNCLIQPHRSGLCRTRVHRDGKLFALNYGACSAIALDPIEKKPLYHFYPGAEILSLGSWGCNFTCQFCQNWQIAQQMLECRNVSPEQAAHLAASSAGKNIGVAYTYSEPGVWFEFILDTAAAVREANMVNVVVTNGFINREPLRELLPLTDAMNIDVKAFTEKFYRTVCSGALSHVKRTVEQAVQFCHVEVTTLLIPGMNDSAQEVGALAKWLSELNPDIPLHLSRYFPNYRMNLPPTPVASLQLAWQTAREYLNYVYLGNAGASGANTTCPKCGIMLIDRLNRAACLTKDCLCPQCGISVPIVGRILY